MNIYVYSDESGVFDVAHNDFFVFAGVILLGKPSKDEWSRRYAHAEKVLRKKNHFPKNFELKATNLSNPDKYSLFRSLNQCNKFGVVIEQNKIIKRIFKSKKDKQRYLDYAYKIAVKRAFERMIENGSIIPTEVERIYFYVDEHTTATNGIYELQEALEQEFKFGTYNHNYMTYFPPLFKGMKEVNVKYCNSKNNYLVRAADIIANRVYYLATCEDKNALRKISNLNLIYLPYEKEY